MDIILLFVKKSAKGNPSNVKHFAMSKKGCTFAPVFVGKNRQKTKQ